MGKLIIIEGGDGSGKATQTGMLWERLCREGVQTRKIEFPNYQSPSSALVKMYLKGDFGQDPQAVNPYAASAFYAVDRYASFKQEWEVFYQRGGIILADRYTTSNMIHQAVKIEDTLEWNAYLDWLKDFEYKRMGLPEPDLVIYLNVLPEISLDLIAGREDKSTVSQQDIHEKNTDYLKESFANAQKICIRENWVNVQCVKDGSSSLKTIEEIHEEVYNLVKPTIFT